MRRPSSTPCAWLRAVRCLLAAALACVLVAASIPAGAVSEGHGCQMPCCKGKGGGAAGHCDGGSCPVSLAPAPTPEPPAPEPMCGASPAPTRHKAKRETSHEAKHEASHEAKHGPHHDASSHKKTPRAPSFSASVSRPCPPDCGALLNSFTQLRKTRDGAALVHGLRPRPPTAAALPRAFAHASKTSSELRRQSPPRAPPLSSPAA